MARKETEKKVRKKVLERLEHAGDEWSWLDRYAVDWGDGKRNERYVAGVMDGVFVLPILDNGNVLLVHQYRLFGRGWMYELPGGGLDEGLSEEAAALKELEAETGYTAGELEKIFSYDLDPNTRGTIHCYVASKLKKVGQRLELAERDLTVREVTPTQLWEMVLDGTIVDSRSVITVLVAKEKGRLKADRKHPQKHPF